MAGRSPHDRGARRDTLHAESTLSTQSETSPEDTLAFLELLWAMDHGLNRMSKRMLATFGVTGPQRVVIRLVGRFPGLTAGEIADRAHTHPSTLSVILRRLEEQDYVVRQPDPTDHRRVRLFLSPEGAVIDQQFEGTVEAAVHAALGRLEPAERQGAAKLLRSLVDELTRAVLRRS